ncbi:MAG: thioesterase family protein [Verrucomicrobiota bacterium]|nr:thioesterase family protein [Verrucomicrobiota bacterium]
MCRETKIEYRVPYADTDQMGVVYYANYLTYFERVRNEFLREIGYSYLNFEKAGYMLPVMEARCFYKAPAKYDDILTIHAWRPKIKNARIQLSCKVMRDEKLLAEGYTVHACIDIKTRKPKKIPEDLQKRILL